MVQRCKVLTDRVLRTARVLTQGLRTDRVLTHKVLTQSLRTDCVEPYIIIYIYRYI